MVGISSNKGTGVPKIRFISNDEANEILKRIAILSGDIVILFSELVVPNLKKAK
jgi:DNA-directed RNA polymerase subunit H (RpoH/RPB5)